MDSPGYFSGASETARDVAAEYAKAPIGALPEHHLEKKTELPPALATEMTNLAPTGLGCQPATAGTDKERARNSLRYLLEVYIDDFIAAAIARSPEELKHISRALLHAIHDVFPEGKHSPDDQPVSIKKMDKGEAQWDVLKEVLGWLCDGREKTIRLPGDKVDKIVGAIQEMLRCNAGTPFDEFRQLMGRLQHASIGVPAGKGFMTPLNHQLAKSPTRVWFRKGSIQREALELWKSLLHDAMTNPTRTRELLPASPDYIGLKDASRDGAGGVWLSGNKTLAATVWRIEWPEEIKRLLDNKVITINDLEMAGNLLGWLVLEGMGIDIKHCHVAILNDNKAAISWILRWAAHSKGPAGRLIIALALRQRERRASPLTPAHVAGELNRMADVASRSFGYKKEWECKSTEEFLTLFDRLFPLPKQSSWQSFLLSSKIVTKVTDALQMKPLKMHEWRRLPRIGTSISRPGASMCNLGELTRTWEAQSPSERRCTTSQASERWSAQANWATESKSELGRFVQRLLPLPRPSLWTEGKCPSTTNSETTTRRSAT